MSRYDRSSRGDVHQAESEFERVKGTLVYKDEETLETGMEKVQPLEHLDGEILRHRDDIKDSLSAAHQVNDDVPGRLLSQLDGVIEEARSGKTTLFKASALLDFTSKAFLYARQATLDRMDLSHTYSKTLSQFDEAFSKMMAARLKAQMHEALDCQKKCIECVERVVEEAEDDMQTYKRFKEEEMSRSEMVRNLKELQSDVPSSIKDEIDDLEMIRLSCKNDMDSIDSSMVRFERAVKKASEERAQQEKDRKTALQKNQSRQNELQAQLRELEEKERRLKRELEEGEWEEKEAQEASKITHRQVAEWRQRIDELQHKVTTSLNIMAKMKDITDMIIKDAQKKRRGMEDHLEQLQVESLRGKREALLARGVMCMRINSDCETNIKAIEEELKELEKKKLAAARTMLMAKVDAANRDIEAYRVSISDFEKQLADSKEKLAHTRHALQEVDNSLHQLKSTSKLESLEERYKERTKCMREK